jgi:light-regulated signal transduction histidine kinase (bacteriophytochrome)
LRAPLRAVGGFSKILLEDFAPQMPSKAQNLLNTVIESVNRMGELVEDLLQFSRLSRQPLSKRTVNVAALASEVLDEVRKQEGDRDVEVRVGELPECQADLALLRQVFINLLSNAFKFTRRKEHAVVEVGCRRENDGNVYFVRDNGAGFDMRYADNLFGVFQRMHGTDEFPGTGVGLSIAHRIIQRHGGRIWADARLNEGATFFFTV